jgi:ribosomal protein S18 acetylase RimI-like enzyme
MGAARHVIKYRIRHRRPPNNRRFIPARYTMPAKSDRGTWDKVPRKNKILKQEVLAWRILCFRHRGWRQSSNVCGRQCFPSRSPSDDCCGKGWCPWTSLNDSKIETIKPVMASTQLNTEQSENTPEQIAPAPILETSSGERSIADRKLGLLQRAGLFGTDTRGATIERAYTLDDLREAYRLVHQVYLGSGFLHPEPAGLRLRIYETTSETATFVAKKDGQVVGVLSVVSDSPDLGLPSDVAFKAELDELRTTGSKLCEVTNQAVDEGYRKSAVPTELMRCAIAHSVKAGYHVGIVSVSPSHHGFYDLMGFRHLGSERSYSEKIHDPVVALSMDINQWRQPVASTSPAEQFMHHFAAVANPFLTQVSDWARQAVRHFLNPELLEQLFVADRNFLSECSPAELLILQRRWGQELFGAVTGTSYPPFGDDVIAKKTPVSRPSTVKPTRENSPPEVDRAFSRRNFQRSRVSVPDSGARSPRSRRKAVHNLNSAA